MSRTWRQKEGIKYRDGRLGRNVPYICRCHYCTGVDRKALQEKIVDREMKKQINELHNSC